MIRVYIDGCFDLAHYGHANALRQAAACGDSLVVGVHSDEAITAAKGQPITSQALRSRLLKSMRWCDEFVGNSPYSPELGTLAENNCDFAVHADATTTKIDGSDAYADFKAVGKFRRIQRTGKISTTHLIDRILAPINLRLLMYPEDKLLLETMLEDFLKSSPQVKFVSHSCVDKMDSASQSKQNCVYFIASWDMFNDSQLDALEAVSKNIKRVVAGVLTDKCVYENDGIFPLLTSIERALSVIACKYVDEVHLNVTNDWMKGIANTIPHELDRKNRFIQPVVDRRDEYIVRNQRKKCNQMLEFD